MRGSDSRAYEIQIIDAVKSVNKALGGTTSISSSSRSRSGRSEFNQYEVQLVDAIKSIGRTISGGGLNIGSGAGSYPDLYIGTTRAQKHAANQALTGITDITASGKASIGGGIKLPNTKKIWFGDDSEEGAPYLELFRANPPAAGAEDTEDPIWSLHTNINLVIDGWASVGGINTDSGSGGVDLPRVWQSLCNAQDPVQDYGDTTLINALHIPVDGTTIVRENGVLKSLASFGTGSQYQYLMANGSGAPIWQSAGSVASNSYLLVSGANVFNYFLETVEGVTKIKSSLLPSSDMYIGQTKAHSAAQNEILYGVNGISYSSQAPSSGTDGNLMYWDTTYSSWRINGNLIVEGWASVGGANPGSGSELVVTLNGQPTLSPTFYAPTTYGGSGQFLAANGQNASPVWQPLPTGSSIAKGIVQVDGTSIRASNGVISGFAGAGLDGLTAPKKIIVCTTIPSSSSMESDAIYLQVSSQ